MKDYVDHLAQIEMCKEKQSAESERQQIQQLEQDYNDIEREQYCILDQILSLKFHELNLYLVRQGIVFQGEEARELYIWHYIIIKGYTCIASSILSGMEKGTPLCEKLQLQAQKVMKRKGL